MRRKATCVILSVLIFATVFVIEVTKDASSQVTEEWVARYNGPGDYNDHSNAIAVGPFGNVYVTGLSTGSGQSSDIAAIKYDPSGNEVWVARYNGPGNSLDGSYDIAVDSLGNIYVTGRCVGVGGSLDYITIKYDTNGNKIWEAGYNCPANETDIARAIALDSLGNVYVTGDSYGGFGTRSDYATIKYDSNGNELWVARYNGPGNKMDKAYAIALDSLGNVYVTGDSIGYIGTSYDYATIKYDTYGNELWVARYNGPGNDWDRAWDVAVDSLGNVYVTGLSWGIGTIQDYATIAYDSYGNELWVARYNGPGNRYDCAFDVALDSSGNVYVTGESGGSGTASDFATIKYDSSGKELWVARYDASTGSSEQGWAMTLDSSGNIYVTGRGRNSVTSWDYITIAYDNSGNMLWVARYNGPGNGPDTCMDIVVDTLGNVYVTGSSTGNGTEFDYATIKYSQQFPNKPPIADAGSNKTVNEGDVVQFNGSVSYDPDGSIETYEWDFNASDGLWWETSAVPDAVDPTPTYIYGDNGLFIVTLRVTDDDNLTGIDTCNITVLNVDPAVTIESAIMDVEIGLRVAGRKYNDVGMTLYEDGNPIGYASIERMPGPPNNQIAWIPITLDLTKTYSATVAYTPKNPPNVGANPTWVYIKFKNGTIEKIHHTFNVQQSKKRNSEHWNHVEPWEVDLNEYLIGHTFEITSHVTDPGSDDITFFYTYGSQNVMVRYLNNPPNPDPYPSLEVNPRDIMDCTALTYEGPGTVSLLVKDDDDGTAFETIDLV